MTDRLKLYNGALRALGERRLASLTENREPRRHLDDVWDDGFIDAVLEQGQWNFAMRSVQLEYDPDITPGFGYRYAFAKPTDYIRTAAVCSDEFFNSPITQYSDEAGYWYSNLSRLYVKYVSNDESYGGDLSRWPETFTDYAQQHLAEQVAPRLTQAASRLEVIKRDKKKALIDARSKDAMAEATAFMPLGGWASARSRGNRRRGGRVGASLIGE